MTGIIS